MSKSLTGPAAASFRGLAGIASVIGDINIYKMDDLKHVISYWKDGEQIVRSLPDQLSDQNQILVVRHLITPWMIDTRKILEKDNIRNAPGDIQFYYVELNAILQALIALGK